MADAIERIMEGENPVDCFAYQGEEAWHRKGQRLGDAGNMDLNVREIEKAARADWRVYKDDLLAAKSQQMLKGHKGLVRDRDNKLLGLCSSQYKIHQHGEALGDVLQMLVEAKRGAWETVGVLNGGSRIFYSVRLLDKLIPVKNDEIDLFAVATTQHDGSGASDWLITGTRVVCQNTLSLAMTSNLRAVHVGDTAAKVGAARDAILAVGQNVAAVSDGMKQLTEIVLNEQAAQRFLDKVHPVKALPSAEVFDRFNEEKQKRVMYEQDLAMRVQLKIREIHEEGAGQDMAVRGTGYAWLNAVTNYATHHMRSNSKLESDLVGDASKMGRRAYQVLTTKHTREEVLSG